MVTVHRRPTLCTNCGRCEPWLWWCGQLQITIDAADRWAARRVERAILACPTGALDVLLDLKETK